VINNLTMPNVQIGQIKSFGALGPEYEVTDIGRWSARGEWLVPIRVVESGEKLEYRFSRFLQDPEAK
jgi:hypothetical protein